MLNFLLLMLSLQAEPSGSDLEDAYRYRQLYEDIQRWLCLSESVLTESTE